jgi:hypothetical protein
MITTKVTLDKRKVRNELLSRVSQSLYQDESVSIDHVLSALENEPVFVVSDSDLSNILTSVLEKFIDELNEGDHNA